MKLHRMALYALILFSLCRVLVSCSERIELPKKIETEMNKIVVFLDFQNYRESSRFIARGLQLALNDEAPADARVYGIKGLRARVVVRDITEREMGKAFVRASYERGVLAIVCHLSAHCVKARSDRINPNVTFIAVTATSARLQQIPNMVFMSPSNGLQAQALHKVLMKDHVKNYIVIYEPILYGIDLFNSLMAADLQKSIIPVFKTDKNGNFVLDENMNPILLTPPRLLATFPYYGEIPIPEEIQGISLEKISDAVIRMGDGLEAVVYLGFSTGFLKAYNAINERLKKARFSVPQWYAGDGVFTDAFLDDFRKRKRRPRILTQASLHRDGLVRAYCRRYYDCEDHSVKYNFRLDYGYDTGQFLRHLIIAARSEDGSENGLIKRKDFLKYAQTEQISGITGTKGYALQNKMGIFQLHEPVAGRWKTLATIRY